VIRKRHSPSITNNIIEVSIRLKQYDTISGVIGILLTPSRFCENTNHEVCRVSRQQEETMYVSPPLSSPIILLTLYSTSIASYLNSTVSTWAVKETSCKRGRYLLGTTPPLGSRSFEIRRQTHLLIMFKCSTGSCVRPVYYHPVR
jgi:hypothetical protein